MARPEDSAWAVSVAQVASRPGQSKTVDVVFPAPSGIGDEVIGVKEGAKARSHGKPKNEDVEIVAGEDESEDVYPLSRDGAFADLEALLRDTLVEALPLQPLCREDCRGLCSQCGVDLNEHPDHHHDVTDLRFAALAGLKAQLEAEEHGDK